MTETISLVCPACGGKTNFNDDIESWVCKVCGNENIFQLDRSSSPEPSESILARPIQPKPRIVNIHRRGSSLELYWRWFSAKYIPLALFCIAWDSLSIFWYRMAFESNSPWIIKVIPISFITVGVGLTYITLAGFLNMTRIRIDENEFTVEHNPLPWPGEVNGPVKDLIQLFCQVNHPVSRQGLANFELAVVLENGRQLRLLSNLDSPDVGMFIEHQIEKWLTISDTPVANELIIKNLVPER